MTFPATPYIASWTLTPTDEWENLARLGMDAWAKRRGLALDWATKQWRIHPPAVPGGRYRHSLLVRWFCAPSTEPKEGA